jgi:hypothetical protein
MTDVKPGIMEMIQEERRVSHEKILSADPMAGLL